MPLHTDEHPAMAAAGGVLKRSMSSREVLARAGKEIAKSVVVAKAAEVGARRLGITALASSTGAAAWLSGLLVARKFHSEYLDPVSSNQINRDPEYVMNCHLLIDTYDTIKAEDLLEVFDFYVKKFTRFRSRVVVRQFMWPYWEEMPQEVDLAQHIFTDNSEMNHEKLQDYISKSLTTGMNPLIPLWKVVHFTNFTFPDGKTGQTVFFKFHHCMGDGFSIARTLMTAVTDRPVEQKEEKKKLVERVHQPGQIGKALGAAAKLLTIKDDPASTVKANTLLKPLDNRRACWVTSRMPITELKKAAKSKGYTINDLILAALAAALRNYQLKKGEKVVDPLAAVWVALRPIAEAWEPQDMNRLQEPSNQTLGAVYVRLPVTGEYENRFDRVQAIVDEIGKLKGSPEPLLAQGFMKLFGLLPSRLTNGIWDALSNKVSIAVSNVPGPTEVNFSWAGVKPTNLTVMVPPVGTISTFCVIMSFNDRLTLALAMDGALFSKEDANIISKEFDDELCLLTTSMQGSRL